MGDVCELQQQRIAAILEKLAGALQEHRLDDAKATFDLLRATAPISGEYLTLMVFALLAHGRARDALHCLNEAGVELPELRVFCLFALRDPLWEGLAISLETNGNPHVRSSMQMLLRNSGKIC